MGQGQGQVGQPQPKGHDIGRWAHINVKLHFYFSVNYNESIENTTVTMCERNSTSGCAETYAINVAMLMEISFICLASAGLTVCSVVFGHSPLRSLHALIKNFWFILTGSVLCFICMMVLESPKFPNNVADIVLCVAFALADVASTLTYIVALNYISAVLFSIIISVEIPLFLIVQQTFLNDVGPYSAGPFQICGAFLVFLAVVTRPVLQLSWVKCIKIRHPEKNP